MGTGLDQYGRGCLSHGEERLWPSSAKVWVSGATQYVRCRRSPAKAVGTVRDLCWQRPDLAWDHSLGIVPDVRSGRCSWPQRRVPGGTELCASRPVPLKELRADERQSGLVSEWVQYLIGYT